MCEWEEPFDMPSRLSVDGRKGSFNMRVFKLNPYYHHLPDD